MKTLLHPTRKKDDLISIHQSFSKDVYAANKKPKVIITKKVLLKRLSPFLLLVPLLLFLFTYMLITGNDSVQNKWVSLFLFAFTIANVALLDFAVWNYFEGKRKLLIWICELILSALIIYLLV